MGGDAADARVDLVEDECLAAGSRIELCACPRSTLEQLLQRRRVEATLEVGDALEPAFDLVELCGIGLERREEAVQVAPDLAQAEGDLAQLRCARGELGRELLERY